MTRFSSGVFLLGTVRINPLTILFCLPNRYLKQKSRLPDGQIFEFLLWASPANYAYETLVVNEMNGLTDLRLTPKHGNEKITSPTLKGEDITRCFGFNDQIPEDLRTLGFMAAIYFGAVWLAMEVFGRERR